MRQSLFLAVALMLLPACQYIPGTKEHAQQVGAAAAAALLRDPSSAQFRNVVVSDDKREVCGEINGKNAFGGYAGFEKFIVSYGKARLRPDYASIYTDVRHQNEQTRNEVLTYERDWDEDFENCEAGGLTLTESVELTSKRIKRDNAAASIVPEY